MPDPLHHLPEGAMDWMNAHGLQSVFDALGPGMEARIVGGAVRSALMGHAISDVDIATTLVPEQVMERVRRAGLKAVPTGIAHGTVTVISEHFPFEVTTLRADVDTDGRHAVVRYTDNWVEDAARRDFTVNAIYCDRDGRLFDPLGGLADIDTRTVRFVGDPSLRIQEDYLRILRFFRFSAQLSDGLLDRAGLKACRAETRGLGRISAARVTAELVKLLAARTAGTVLREMRQIGILGRYLPGARQLERFERLGALEAMLGRPADSFLRLAMLYGGRTPVARLSELLELSNSCRKRLQALNDAGGVLDYTPSFENAKTLLYRLGPGLYRDQMLLSWSAWGRSQRSPHWSKLFNLPEVWPVPVFPLTGRDVMTAGVPKGPAVGRILARLEQRWIEAGYPHDPALVRSWLTEQGGG